MIKCIEKFPTVEVELEGPKNPQRTAEIARLQQVAHSFGATTKYVTEAIDGVLIGFKTENPEALSVILQR